MYNIKYYLPEVEKKYDPACRVLASDDYHHAHHNHSQVRVLRSSLDNLTKERDKLRSDLQVIDGWGGWLRWWWWWHSWWWLWRKWVVVVVLASICSMIWCQFLNTMCVVYYGNGDGLAEDTCWYRLNGTGADFDAGDYDVSRRNLKTDAGGQP